jgi:hypothetical protein
MRCSRCKFAGRCREVRAKTKQHFKWSFHNLVGHPLSEFAWLLGLKKLSDRLHNGTLPEETEVI